MIDGVVSGTEWDGAPVAVEFWPGRVLCMNGSTNLYLLIAVTRDTASELGQAIAFGWLLISKRTA